MAKSTSKKNWSITKKQACTRNRNLKRLGYATYSDYLNSDLWSEIRSRVLKRDDGKCATCGKAASQVHHSIYVMAVMRGVDIDPLYSMCDRCHDTLHKTKNKACKPKKKEVKRKQCTLWSELCNRKSCSVCKNRRREVEKKEKSSSVNKSWDNIFAGREDPYAR